MILIAVLLDISQRVGIQKGAREFIHIAAACKADLPREHTEPARHKAQELLRPRRRELGDPVVLPAGRGRHRGHLGDRQHDRDHAEEARQVHPDHAGKATIDQAIAGSSRDRLPGRHADRHEAHDGDEAESPLRTIVSADHWMLLVFKRGRRFRVRNEALGTYVQLLLPAHALHVYLILGHVRLVGRHVRLLLQDHARGPFPSLFDRIGGHGCGERGDDKSGPHGLKDIQERYRAIAQCMQRTVSSDRNCIE